MSGRVWDRDVGPEDAAIIDKAGYGRPMTWWRRPAPLVIDATCDFCGDNASPTREGMERRHNAFSKNLRVVVAEDGCFDRIAVSHAISLFDIDAKYGDVVAADRVADFFGEVEPAAFALPPGGPSGG